MAATPLTEVRLPEQALSELSGINENQWIRDHAISVGRPWWTQTLAEHGFDDTLTGETIRRADIFALSDAAADDPAAALTLLWNALAWGSGDKRRNNKARIAAVAAHPEAAAALLQQAAALSRTDPQTAYELLYPRNRTAIAGLGPAFFTKYLYFAGGGEAHHPCAILDENVALALQKSCGWASLPLSGWLSTAYQRYATLLGMWTDQHHLGRRDSIERWLFEAGKTTPRRPTSGDPS
ncbi:hypothetical protein A7U43_27980 (plasmid) [Mycobacterium adipatum]|uniref:HhH-GPD domain-containing protein n=1 Tax=Mycobacterium adipatum TaxID=1682113 RepID=A0A172UW55_9MYCO|nr:hypothetical protein [Mycobacterium adipatum]ANE83367.1 hypothetical protein A7U43_27980 [Mycobacterium adipatum]